MRTIREFMDDGIRCKRVANDAEIACKCGVSQATISRWRSADRVPEDEEVMVLAEVLGEDPYLMLAAARYAKAKNDETKDAWEGIAAKITQRITKIAASSITVCVLIALGAPNEVYAGVIDGTELAVFRTTLFVLIQWLVFRHPAYDGVHKTCALCIQLISNRSFVGMSALLGHRPVLV